MNGLLLYTTGGGDGSLGGLCSLADKKYFEGIIISSIKDSDWCSADPVCINSEAQGPQRSNMAACHNCLLIPETACDNFNSLLDRDLIINKEYGFFKDLL